MKPTERGYIIECSGRALDTYGTSGFTIGYNGSIDVGYDCSVGTDPEIYDVPLTADEKKEIAMHVIGEWAEWAKIKVTAE